MDQNGVQNHPKARIKGNFQKSTKIDDFGSMGVIMGPHMGYGGDPPKWGYGMGMGMGTHMGTVSMVMGTVMSTIGTIGPAKYTIIGKSIRDDRRMRRINTCLHEYSSHTSSVVVFSRRSGASTMV